jgi:hypothetical protein
MLGTIVNLNRIERPELDGLYAQIDALRATIGEGTRLVDRLTAEREGFHRGALLRGAAAIALVVIAGLTAVLILFATVR